MAHLFLWPGHSPWCLVSTLSFPVGNDNHARLLRNSVLREGTPRHDSSGSVGNVLLLYVSVAPNIIHLPLHNFIGVLQVG